MPSSRCSMWSVISRVPLRVPREVAPVCVDLLPIRWENRRFRPTLACVLHPISEAVYAAASLSRSVDAARRSDHSSSIRASLVSAVGDLRVRGAGVFQPQDVVRIVDQVPDSASAGDFVLPLRHHHTAMNTGGQIAFELMMPWRGRRPVWPPAYFLVGDQRVGRSRVAQVSSHPLAASAVANRNSRRACQWHDDCPLPSARCALLRPGR